MSKKQINVLIADDEYTIRNGLRMAVPWETLNMSVIGMAEDGNEAMNVIMSYHPDIVITDIKMPNLDGLQLLQKAREVNIDSLFIILSGYDDFSYAQKAIRYGAKAYLLKPLRMNELIDELTSCQKLIDVHRLDDDIRKFLDVDLLKEDSKKLFLNQLIQSDSMPYEKIQDKITTLKISIRNQPIQVLVFEFCNEKADFAKECTDKAIDLISHVFCEFKKEVWAYNNHQIVAIINVVTLDSDKSLYDYCQICLGKLNELDCGSVIIGIGDKEEGLKRCFYSINNALSALSYKLYQPNRSIFDSSIICDIVPEVSANSIDTKPLIESIMKQDKQRVIKYCNEFFNILLYVPMPPPSYIKGMCIYLISDVQKTLKTVYNLTISEIITELPYSEIGYISSLKYIREYMINYFIKLVDGISEDMKHRPDSVIAAAKEYIKNNIDKKISAEEVASCVNLSVAYFTVYFKSKTGINFRNYLLTTKMEFAKQLLIRSKLSISEIGSAIGYDDYRSFYRVFKNYTGETPSEYVHR